MHPSPAHYVIGKFGGLTKTANAIGLGVTTVQGWSNRGSIPPKHWRNIIEAARLIGEELELSDFIQEHCEQARAS